MDGWKRGQVYRWRGRHIDRYINKIKEQAVRLGIYTEERPS
jgi:hypothetical protein